VLPRSNFAQDDESVDSVEPATCKIRRPDVTALCQDKFDLNHELSDGSVITATYYTYVLSP
jgi:hypothetical protein